MGSAMKNDLIIPSDFTEKGRNALRQAAEDALKKCSAQFKGFVCEDIVVEVRFESGAYGGEAHFDHIDISIAEDQLGGDELCELIHHEMVHFFQNRLIGKEHQYKLPHWFSEGMAVALSGQGIIFEGKDVEGVVSKFLGAGVDEYIFMRRGRRLDYNKEPFDNLYPLWGLMFIYAVSSGARINHGYKEDDGPYLHADEIGRAMSMIERYRDAGFVGAVDAREDKERLTSDNVSIVLADFAQYPMI